MNDILQSEFDLLVYWIHERDSIRRLKESGSPRPWTSDPLLQNYRWCNVSRMDDRVSIDLMKYWYTDADWRTQLVAASLGRLINRPEALLDATNGRPFRFNHLGGMRSALHARARRGAKVFTGAYVIPGAPGENKIDTIIDVVTRIAESADAIWQSRLRLVWQLLIEQRGVGSFLAGQICADLAHLYSGKGWPDRFAWAPVGPGSARGMNRLRGRPKAQALSQTDFDQELADYMAVIAPHISAIATDRKLGAQDYQSTLCEFDKYRRLQLGEGTVRMRYDGEARPQASFI